MHPRPALSSRRGILTRGESGLARPATTIREVSGDSKEVRRQARCIIAQRPAQTKAPPGDGAKLVMLCHNKGLPIFRRTSPPTQREAAPWGCWLRMKLEPL
jgi:hypothetical protein